jgi:hypothetical protein
MPPLFRPNISEERTVYLPNLVAVTSGILARDDGKATIWIDPAVKMIMYLTENPRPI